MEKLYWDASTPTFLGEIYSTFSDMSLLCRKWGHILIFSSIALHKWYVFFGKSWGDLLSLTILDYYLWVLYVWVVSCHHVYRKSSKKPVLAKFVIKAHMDNIHVIHATEMSLKLGHIIRHSRLNSLKAEGFWKYIASQIIGHFLRW